MEGDKKTSHTREPRVQLFPDNKAAINRHDSMAKTNTNNKKDPQKKHRLGMARKKITGGFKLVLRYQPQP